MTTERDRYLRGVARQEQERLNRERRRHARPLRYRLARASRPAWWIFWLLFGAVIGYAFVHWATAGLAPAGGGL